MNNFKPIPGYEKLYAVDMCGNVMRTQKGNGAAIPGKILKHETDKKGYRYVRLYKNGYKKNIKIHRLVVMTHLSQISPGLQVNHINGIKADNRIENLELVTASENVRHSLDVLGVKRATGGNHASSIPVLDTVTGIFYTSITEAAQSIGMNRHTLYNQITGRNPNKTNLKLV